MLSRCTSFSRAGQSRQRTRGESLSQELFHAAEKPIWYIEDFADLLARKPT
jgi:hypothetical protein